MIGENIVDDTCWIIKSHHPFPKMDAREFDANKIVVCVRNPFDVIISVMNMLNLSSQSAYMEGNPFDDELEVASAFTKEMSSTLNGFFNHIHG